MEHKPTAVPSSFTANYHTHTARCHHAAGTERDYIENAIKGGLRTLGFSDHSPYFFKEGYYSNFRMYREDFPDYVQTLLELREEYRDRIEILIGLEAEYYPKHFDQLLEFIAPYPMDYLILGQHYTVNEYDGFYSGHATDEEAKLVCYADQVIEGMQTGKFAYLAHPDLLNFHGDEKIYRRHMRRVCEAAKALDIPLELNFLGYCDGRWYPREDFLEIAAEVGNIMIFGCDAHSPECIPFGGAYPPADPGTSDKRHVSAVEGCTRLLEKYGLERTENIRMTLRK